MNTTTPADLLQACHEDAIAVAMQEADTTPLEPGTIVGHVDVERFGNAPAKLESIIGDVATVVTEDGEVLVWEKNGTVSVDRVDDLMNEYMMATVREIQLIRTIEQLTRNAANIDENDPLRNLIQELENMQGIGGPGLPTPGCDCPHCATFTPEQHAEAAAKAQEMGLDVKGLTPTTEEKPDLTSFI